MVQPCIRGGLFFHHQIATIGQTGIVLKIVLRMELQKTHPQFGIGIITTIPTIPTITTSTAPNNKQTKQK